MANPKYKKGSIVNFECHAKLKINNVKIEAVVPKQKDISGKEIEPIHPLYVIENENGWSPNMQRQKLYGLNPKKKYLFAAEYKLSINNT